jgi:uncharacterized membrane protein
MDAPLVPEQVIKNIEAIAEHQEQFRQNINTPQRIVAEITDLFARPGFLYLQLIIFICWFAIDRLTVMGILPRLLPELVFHDQILDMSALLISTGVLINESRQAKLSDDRSHLALQLNLITEQKIAKLISLVEELRTDLPNVNNRHDPEAKAMQQATDPQAILEVIQENLEPSSTPKPE